VGSATPPSPRILEDILDKCSCRSFKDFRPGGAGTVPIDLRRHLYNTDALTSECVLLTADETGVRRLYNSP